VGFILGVQYIRMFIEITWQSLGGLRNSDLFAVVTIIENCLSGIAAMWTGCPRGAAVSYSGDLVSILGLDTGLMVACCQHSLHTHEIHKATPRALHSFQLFAMYCAPSIINRTNIFAYTTSLEHQSHSSWLLISYWTNRKKNWCCVCSNEFYPKPNRITAQV